MFDRIANGFAMARSSWGVLMSDKKLLLFPTISGILSVIVLISFAIPLGILFERGQLFDANQKLHIWVYPIIFAFYFVSYFVVIFCNAALVSCAILRFNGQESTLGDGFRAAMSRFPQILGWALVSASVGMLLKAIENVHEKLGALVSSLLGAAWSIMTYFVVPVLVVEKLGPIEAIGRSTSLLKKTWGEALVGKIGLGLFLFLLAIPIGLLFIAGVVVLAQSQALGIALLAVAGVCLLMYLAVSAAMNSIFLTAVYQYAAYERAPDGFDQQALSRAFASK
jgi:hypothetical protein